MSQVAPVMHREPVELDTRYIPKALRARVFSASEGRCALCGAKIAVGAWECDHVIRWSDGGRTEFGNLQALCLPCHDVKTRTQDTPGAARTKRMGKSALPRDPDEIEPSRIRGRGFDKTKTRSFKGQVKPRKQRAPNVQQALSGGAEDHRSDCETNHNTTTAIPQDHP